MEKSDSIKYIKIYYLINDESEMKEMKIDIEDDNINFLSYDSIIDKFISSLKKDISLEIYNLSELNYNNIIFDFIRYLDDNNWLLLEEHQFIFLNDVKNIELMIKVSLLSDEKINIKNNYDRNIEKISKIEQNLNNLTNKEYQSNNLNICSNNNYDLIVLTSNPLMDKDKELRTMNDFNKVTSSIHEAIQESIQPIKAEFYPLTKSKFEEIISKKEYKPTILHLICKSTFNIPNNTPIGIDSKNYINLIFENEDYNLELINKEYLENIINKNDDIKNNIKEMTLIISTQLSEDVYSMFEEFNFKNILVQHTTLTDVDYLSEYNFNFYNNLTFSDFQNIQDLHEESIHSYMDPKYQNVFCCCFHSHEELKGKECHFMRNIKNELYNENKDNKYETIPHFFHLRVTDQNSTNYDYTKNFCSIKGGILKTFNNENKILHLLSNYNSSTKYYNICCCKKKEHNKASVFSKKFNETEENRLLKFGGKKNSEENKNKYIPDYSKMNLLVGKNKIIYDVINSIKNKNCNINIYCDEINNEYTINDLRDLANIIIEYIKEREENNEINDEFNELKKISSFKPEQKIVLNYEDINIKNIKSSPIIEIQNNELNNKYELIDLSLNDSENPIEFDFSKINVIYFVIVGKEITEKFVADLKKIKNRIVVLSLYKIDKIQFNSYQKLENLNQINKYVKGQLNEINDALRLKK